MSHQTWLAAGASAVRAGVLRRRAAWRLWWVWALLSGWLLAPTWALADTVWLDAAGRPRASAREALGWLADAASDGLLPLDYAAHELGVRAAGLDAGPAPDVLVQAAFERDLEAALLRYLRDLRAGRVDPWVLGFRIRHRDYAVPDLRPRLRVAAAEQDLASLRASLRPPLAQYDQLRLALARYRALADDDTLTPLPALGTATPLRPGAAYAGAAALHRRLRAWGDLPADAPPPLDRYDPAWVEGVKRFQQRHGLAADGEIGRATLVALNVPLAQRVRQIEWALERLRWLPELGTQRVVAINIPMFRLWAWDPADPAAAPFSTEVVVGRALETQTPVLAADMRYLIFRPYWNVPRSIVRKELLPLLLRDPGYLQRHDMEIVQGGGDDAPVVDASAQNLTLLGQGALRLRQRPGPQNALGRIKFIFPNQADVYLHDTPATRLFGRARRDFSHGCVRVKDPLALAQWVLQDQPRWTRERIEAAMTGSTTLRLDLRRPLPVILFYLTALVMPGDDALHFADDIYGHDARLARALAARPAP